MLKNSTTLKTSKNLLAFSAGGDSTALFFLLLEHNIKFDIAIVDYGLREQSKEELMYAKELAKRYTLHCFVYTSPKIEKNFEAKAREVRYRFFESLIDEKDYDVLLTGHHLGDRVEWMLMQFCKGAGIIELAGMQELDKRSNYSLIRPLLHLDKSELLKYLHSNEIKYFEDESNSDKNYKRNEFRHNYAQPLLEKYHVGIAKSFEYIDEDRDILVQDVALQTCNSLVYFRSTDSKRSDIFHIDRYFKSLEKIISSKERNLLKTVESLVISREYIVCFWNGYVLIAPYISVSSMPKVFKEKMRRLKLPPKLRAYLVGDGDSVALLSELLQ